MRAASISTPARHIRLILAAAALAFCALKTLGDAEFRAEVRAEFERS